MQRGNVKSVMHFFYSEDGFRKHIKEYVKVP